MTESTTLSGRFLITPIQRLAHFFANLSIRWKIVLTTVIFTTTLTIATLVLVFRGYSADRLAYVFENHSAQVVIASARVKEALVKITATANSEVITSVPKSLSRMPEDEEIFIEESKEKRGSLEIFWRDEEGDVVKTLSTPAVLVSNLSQIVTTNFMVASQKGTLIFASHSPQFTEDQQRQLYQLAIKNNMNSGNTVVEYNEKPFAVGFSEIAQTNLIAVTATSLANITAPLQRAMAIWGIIALQFIALGAGLQWLFAGRITRPIESITRLFALIARGNFRMQLELPQGEMRPVVEGAMTMQRAIATRERRLALQAQGLKDILDLRRQIELTRTPQKLAREIIERLNKAAPLHAIAIPVFADFSTNESATFHPATDDAKARWDRVGAVIYGLAEFVNTDELKNGGHSQTDKGVLQSFYGNTSAPALIIPFRQQENLLGAIILPLDPAGTFPELLELVSVSVTTIESMFTQMQAADSATKQAMLDRELSLAREIQERSISISNLSLTQVKIQSLFHPANMVGGDWMAIFEHPKTKTVHLYIGDVTGHGIDAAFHTSLVAGAIQLMESQLEETQTSSEAFDIPTHLRSLIPRLNDVLVKSGAGKQMTMFMAILEVQSGILHFGLLGHPPPLVIRGSGNAHTTLAKEPAPSLGSVDYPENPPVHQVQLNPGDSVVAFTDGLTENIIMSEGQVLSRKVLLKNSAEIVKKCFSEGGDSEVLDAPQSLFQWSLKAGSSYEENDDVAIMTVQWNG
jgi:hypothetical protein